MKPLKRGRPPKTKIPITKVASPNQQSLTLSQGIPPTPQSQIATLPHHASNLASAQGSPPKSGPVKSTVIVKALPTVRDHTTDQLGAGGDEYKPREYDEAGEKKVNPNGQLNGGREYKCRTFLVPNRGDKLFMLATECARVLGYRDSYLLFNKNRSLFKIIASQVEKEDLIHQEVLPFSYRSRQIAIVTARSMFRQFGSRVIRNGRRVRDDYWEGKARKQGFTEEDLAGEKRPGAAKARDAAAAAEASANASAPTGPSPDILYSNSPTNSTSKSLNPSIQTNIAAVHKNLSTLPMISLTPEQPDLRLRDYSNIQRPKQEIAGPAYQDRTQPSSPSDLLSHAHQTADYNKQINQQRCQSSEFLHHHWRQSHEVQNPNNAQRPIAVKENLQSSRNSYSPRVTQSNEQLSAQQAPQQINATQPYTQVSQLQNPNAASPMRIIHPSPMQQQNQLVKSSGVLMAGANMSGGATYGYNQQGQMWATQAQAPSQAFPHFTQQSPHLQPSPHQAALPSRHPGNDSQMPQALQYPGIQGLGQGYPAPPAHNPYSSDRGSQQYMTPNTPAPQMSGQIWAGQQSPSSSNNWGWTGPTQ